MMRTSRATAPGFALPLGAGTAGTAQAPVAAAAGAVGMVDVNANTSRRPVTRTAAGATAPQPTDGVRYDAGTAGRRPERG